MTTELDRLLELYVKHHTIGFSWEENKELTNLKSQIESKLAQADELRDRTIHTDEKGIKTKYSICIYTPRNDLWVDEEYGNLINLNNLEVAKYKAEQELSQLRPIVKALRELGVWSMIKEIMDLQKSKYSVDEIYHIIHTKYFESILATTEGTYYIEMTNPSGKITLYTDNTYTKHHVLCQCTICGKGDK